MNWPVRSIGSVGCCYGRHGNETEPPSPTITTPAEAGCGDYVRWLGYESRQLGKEEQHVREERFTPHDCSVPDGTEIRMYPTPWAAEFYERREIAGELVRQGLRGNDVAVAIDLTMFARRFVRWAEEGFPMGDCK